MNVNVSKKKKTKAESLFISENHHATDLDISVNRVFFRFSIRNCIIFIVPIINWVVLYDSWRN